MTCSFIPPFNSQCKLLLEAGTVFQIAVDILTLQAAVCSYCLHVMIVCNVQLHLAGTISVCICLGEAGVLVVLHLRSQVSHAAHGAGARHGASGHARVAVALHCAALARPLHARLLFAFRYVSCGYY